MSHRAHNPVYAGSSPATATPLIGRIMQADAVLIQTPNIDFTKFLGLSHKMFGFSPAKSADASHRQLNDSERFLSCLAALKDDQSPVGLPPHLLTHVSFSVLLAASERDLLDVLEYCAGMPFVAADTIARGIQAAVVTGTLAQWRDAVISGCQAEVEQTVRILFNKILGIFESNNLKVWNDCAHKQSTDKTLLLEDLR